MSNSHVVSRSVSRQSRRLIACLLFLLLALLSPFVEQVHVEDCDATACVICTTLAGSALPAPAAYAPIIPRPVGPALHQSTQLVAQLFSRHYDSRGPPHVS